MKAITPNQFFSAMAGNKWYVVWVGTEPGICETWAECQQRVVGYPGARYKGFKSREEAILAFRGDGEADKDLIRAIAKAPTTAVNYAAIPEIYPGSIAVDGACSQNPGPMEYRGVEVFSGKELFRQGPFEDGTNNVGEFLAIVHALAWLNNQGKSMTAIYSDSRTAMSWVRNKHCNTKLERTERNAKLFDIVARAEHWLQTHTYTNFIIKWQTDKWGEIPADFGRK